MRMRHVRAAGLAALCLLAGPAAAEDRDYSEGSQAKPWNILNSELARFEGKVVDVLCELTGDCVENCGDGRRQLGIVRKDDNRLIIANKNGQFVFSGAIEDLLPYCNQEVEVDGQFTGFDEAPVKLYQIQFIKRVGEPEFQKANGFTKAWNARFPEQAKQKGPWFRKDPRITSRTDAEGYLGLGEAADRAFIIEDGL